MLTSFMPLSTALQHVNSPWVRELNMAKFDKIHRQTANYYI